MNTYKIIMTFFLLFITMTYVHSNLLATTYGVDYILFKKNNIKLHYSPIFQGSYLLDRKKFSQFIIRYNICYSGLKDASMCLPIHFYVHATKTKKADVSANSVKFFFTREKKEHSIESGFIKVDKYELKRKSVTVRGEVIYKNNAPRDGGILFIQSQNTPLKKLKNCEELEKLVEDKFKPIIEKEFSEYLACHD